MPLDPTAAILTMQHCHWLTSNLSSKRRSGCSCGRKRLWSAARTHWLGAAAQRCPALRVRHAPGPGAASHPGKASGLLCRCRGGWGQVSGPSPAGRASTCPGFHSMPVWFSEVLTSHAQCSRVNSKLHGHPVYRPSSAVLSRPL